MSSDEKYRREIEKRLLDLEKIAKEIFEHIELLKVLLTDPSSQKDLEIVTTETPRKIEEPIPPNCLHYFGYLGLLQKTGSIPDECLICQKVVECSKHIQ
jgi:hypothetical protein